VKEITGMTLARLLNKQLNGDNFAIRAPADLGDCGPGDIVWIKRFTSELLELLETRKPSLVICDAETAVKTTVPHIVSDHPRRDFIRVVTEYYSPPGQTGIHPTALLDPEAKLGNDVSIGAYARIGPKVTIGNESSIGSGVVIEARVSIGKGCVIKANSVLGGQGFGFEYDEDGTPLHFPHLGQIVIEDDVWIGACSTVELATLGTTRICTGCKIDDLVQIGHNTTIGRNTLVMAAAVICGGARIGERCWIAPHTVVKQKVTVGSGVTLGLGAVVLKDIEDNQVVAGVPARPLERKG